MIALTVPLVEESSAQQDTWVRPNATLIAEVREQHERLAPHMEFIGRLARTMDGDDPTVLRSLLLAALNCTDDDLLPYLQWCAVELYPVADPGAGVLTHLLLTQHRCIDQLRTDLRDSVVDDLDSSSAREAVHQHLYELRSAVLAVMKQQADVIVPRL